jgi:hypothetical protein
MQPLCQATLVEEHLLKQIDIGLAGVSRETCTVNRHGVCTMIRSFSTIYPEGRAVEGEFGDTPRYV